MKNNKTLRTLFALIAIVSLLLTASLSIIAQADTGKHFSVVEAATNADSLSISQIAAKTRTSVVAIETESKVTVSDDPFYGYGSPFGGLFGYGFGFGDGYGYGGRGRNREYTSRAAGSGVIISEDGYIVTNNHVISGADKITVYVLSEDGTETTHEATLVGASENNDIAVLKIDAKGLNPAHFAKSSDLEVGELAVVVGNPLGTVHSSVTAGIISALERELTIDNVTIKAIQTDASINPGNSGGGLFDSYGNLVGIVYAKSSSLQIEGIGYAIPIDSVRDLIEQMVNDPDSVNAQTSGSRIMLGITITTVTEEISKQYNMPVGVYVTEVSSMSAAERAGIQRGDIITSFAGEKVTNADDLNTIKAKQTPGDSVEVTVDRNGSEMTLRLIVPQPTDVDMTTGK